MFLLNFIKICSILHEKGYCRQILICTTLFWEHIHCFTNLKFVRENLIFHLFPSVDRFSNNILIFNDRTLRKNMFESKRILRWLGRENKKNVVRTRNCSGWPFSPRVKMKTTFRFLLVMSILVCIPNILNINAFSSLIIFVW